MSLHADVHVVVGDFEERVHLTAADGEVVAVLGPNGSGKSTLLRALAGLVPLTGGRIELDGTVLDDPATDVLVPTERRPTGMVFQDYLLFPHLTVAANVAFGLRSRGATRSEANREAVRRLGDMGLGALASAKPAQLSGGQAQQVALARALAPRPRLLLLDEPMAALDVTVRGSVRHQLRQQLSAFDGMCILVTHDPLDAAALADRLVIIEAGSVVQEGSLQEVTSRPRTEYVADLLGVNLLRGRSAGTTVEVVPGVTLVTASPCDGPVLGVVAPRDVALYLEEPSGSPRNCWQTRVAEVHLMGARARVLLGDPLPMSAEVTTVSLADLGLTEGAPVWASVKATQIDVFPTDAPADTPTGAHRPG